MKGIYARSMSIRRERKFVTVLFADVVSLTRRREVTDPEDVGADFLSGRALRLGAMIVLLSFLPIVSASAAPSSGARAHPVRLTVVAAHLNNPRKIFVGRDGVVYVVEAGIGGHDSCLGTGATKMCIGLSGSIARITKGTQRRVLTGLWSGARTDGELAQGPADVLVRGDLYYVLLQNGSINRRGQNDLGRDGATAGDLISSPAGESGSERDRQPRRLRGCSQPRSWRRPGPAVRRPADRQRSLRLHRLPRRLCRCRCRR